MSEARSLSKLFGRGRFNASEERRSPLQWSPARGDALVNAIERGHGKTTGSNRVNHADGYILTGTFEPTGDMATRSQLKRLSKSEIFGDEPCEAVSRFSPLRGELADDGRDIMGMATRLVAPSGAVSDLIAMTAEVFMVAHSRDFVTFMNGKARGSLGFAGVTAALILTGRSTASSMYKSFTALRARHGNGLGSTFHGVQTFRLVAPEADGVSVSTPMRYRWVPRGTNTGSSYKQHLKMLGDESREMSASFDLELFVMSGFSGVTPRVRRRLDDPRFVWKNTDPIVAGTLTLTKPHEDLPNLGFDPTRLAPGISPGDSELFSGRSGAYLSSQERRHKNAEK